MEIHHISPELLTLDRVSEIMEKGLKLELSDESKKKVAGLFYFLRNHISRKPTKNIYDKEKL